MYIEVDEGYWEHPKTLDFCARMQDERADTYPLRLWKWAVRSAKTGKLGKITAWAIEKAVRYEPMDGKCAEALIASGFIDKGADGDASIHDWMDYTGGAIKKMEKKAKDNRKRREDAKAKYDGEKKENRTAIVPVRAITKDGSILSRQDKTSPDKTREEVSLARDPVLPSTGTPGPVAKRPIGHDLVTLFGSMRLEVFPETLPWNTARDTKGDAGSFAELLSDEEIQDIKPTMRLALEKIKGGADGWTNLELVKSPSFAFGKWKSDFTGLREELHGRVPHVKPAPRPTPPRSPSLGFHDTSNTGHSQTGDIPL
jgi:hypothetical protein